MYLTELVGEPKIQEMSDANWKTRLAAIQSIQETIKSKGEDIDVEAIFAALNKTPGWKENNFQVLTHVCNIFQHLAKEKEKMDKVTFNLIF